MPAYKPVVKSNFSPTMVFMVILAVMLSVFLYSGASTVMTAMGFETKEAVKKALIKSEAKITNLIDVNEQNLKALEVERASNALIRQQLLEVTKLQQESKQVVVKAIAKKDKATEKVVVKVQELTVTTANEVTLPITETN